jgi:hypothetical protein
MKSEFTPAFVKLIKQDRSLFTEEGRMKFDSIIFHRVSENTFKLEFCLEGSPMVEFNPRTALEVGGTITLHGIQATMEVTFV